MRFRRQVPWAARRSPPEGVEAAPTDLLDQPAHGAAAPRTVAGRRLLRDVLIVGATFGVGYLIASAWLSPVPLITHDHTVPRVLELPIAEAQQKLADLGFRARLDDEQPSPSTARGTIVWQDPAPGTILPQRSVVLLVPSAGPQPVPVPDVIGLALPSAAKVLAAAGLKVGDVDTVASDPEPNIVVATRPPVGGARDPGGAVDVVVSGQRVQTSRTARIVAPLQTGARR